MSDYAKLIGELYLVASQAKSNNRRKLLERAADAIEQLSKRIPTVVTNADRIRGLSDEELARFIARQTGRYCDFKDPEEEEYPKVLSWLKAPVEEVQDG